MLAADEAQLVPDDDAHRIWKRSAAPMYDWLTNHHLVWPSLTCRFGAKESKGDIGKYEQTVYYSEQVDKDEKVHNKLISQVVSVHEESYTPIDHINNWKENQKSPYFSKSQAHIINHPGECNKIRTISQMPSMVATHSDCADVFVWDFTKQPSHHANNSKGKRGTRSVPDLKLTGHTDLAPFALATSAASASVASGGDDTNVLLWQLQDKGEGGTDGGKGARAVHEALAPRRAFKGHTKTVSDVCFKPGSDSVLLSSSDDQIVKMWDAREEAAVKNIQQATSDDVLALDWSADGRFIATGDSKGRLQVYDLRTVSDTQAAKPLHEFTSSAAEPKAVLTVSWNPLRPSWLACGGDDGRVSVYDTARPDAATVDRLPAQLVLQHVGHLGNIMDAQWSPHDPFLLMSVSNDGHTYKEGGACQLWRLSWLLSASLADAEAQLKGYQTWLESGKLSDLQDVISVDMSQPGERAGASTRDPSPPAMQEPEHMTSELDAEVSRAAAAHADAAVPDATAPDADMDMADAAAAIGAAAQAEGDAAEEHAMDAA